GDADLGAQAVAEGVGATAATGGDGLESGGGGVGGGGERGLRRHGCWRGGPAGWWMRDDGAAPASGSMIRTPRIMLHTLHPDASTVHNQEGSPPPCVHRSRDFALAPRITGYVIGEPGAPLTSDDAWHVSLTSPVDVPTVPLAVRTLADPSPAPVLMLPEASRVTVYDVLGRRVLALDAEAGPLPLPSLPAGRYLWRAFGPSPGARGSLTGIL